ncbi:MAG: lytic transglycosylase domain-containing protein [Bacteroidetes bacterium]|nr:lytic transglycosylase domain-containing protein [Bacteroidota bacterium]
MRKIYFLSLVVLVAGIILILFLFSDQKKKISDADYYGAFSKNNKIFSPVIPEVLDFAGEEVPLGNILVRENLDRELLINTYWHSSTVLSLKRAYRWFPVIVPILKENNIPEDFKFLALAESALTQVVSPKGAAGFWQFIESTGKIYDLEINKDVDERYNVEKSTQAACRYFLDSFEDYKSWSLVAAAYNAGNRRIADQVEKQKVHDYYDLYLSEETSRYLFRILALKTIYEHPVRYGFYLRIADLYQPIPVEDLKINRPVADLIKFARENKSSYKLLKEFNPWLRSDNLPNASGKTYIIKLPVNREMQIDEHRNQSGDSDIIFNDTIRVNEIN